jgi:hypothetical protein
VGRVRFVGRGHPAIRATHTKTLEISLDQEITERATCVIAVGARPEPAQPMAGPVRITIRAAGLEHGFDADANSAWTPDQNAVIRGGNLCMPPTFAINSSVEADDLPRPLVEALRRPDTTVEVFVDKRPGPPTLVLAQVDRTLPISVQLAVEIEAADVVRAEDPGLWEFGAGRAEEAGEHGRVLLLASERLPGRTVDREGMRIETVGLHPALAAAAAAPWGGPVLIGERGADSNRLLKDTPASHRLVLWSAVGGTSALFAEAASVRGSTRVTVAPEFGHPVVVGTDEPLPFPRGSSVWCCFEPGPDIGLDPAVRVAIDGLLTDGVSTKVAANALAALTGWDRRRAYDNVLNWRAGREG